jgi:sugar/nucleoside kinase (ribokinase family)
MFIDHGEVKTTLSPCIVPVNTTGCGDASCAGFAVSFAEYEDMNRAVAAGIECAVLNAGSVRPGVIR